MARSLVLPIESFCVTIFPLIYAAKTVASSVVDIFRELSKIAPPSSSSPLLFPWRTPNPSPSLRLRPPPLGLRLSSRPPLAPSPHPPPLARSTVIASSQATPDPTSSSSTLVPPPLLIASTTSPPPCPPSPPSPLLPAHRRRSYTMTPYWPPRASHEPHARVLRGCRAHRRRCGPFCKDLATPIELALSGDFIPVVAAFPFPLLHFPSARITFHLPSALLLFSPPLDRRLPDHPLRNHLHSLLHRSLSCLSPPPLPLPHRAHPL